MNRPFRHVGIGLMIGTLAATIHAGQDRPVPGRQLAADSSPTADHIAAQVTALADTYLRAFVASFPEDATMAGFPDVPADRLTNNSSGARQTWEGMEDRWGSEIAGLDSRALWGRPEWVTLGLLREAVEGSRAMRVCRTDLWPVNQMSGWQVAMPRLAARQPVGTPARRSAAFVRWRLLPGYLETEIENLKDGLRLGYSTPRHNVELVISQLDAMLAAPVDEAPLFSPARRDGDAEFRKEWTALLTAEIIPAVRRYRNYLQTEYAPAARQTIAVTALPGGADCYRASLRYYTTFERSADQMWRIGEQEVARQEREARDLAARLFGTGDLAAVRRRLDADPAGRFGSREELLAFSRDAVERARRAAPGWFNTLPAATVVVEAQPAYLERTSSNSYGAAPADRSGPGTYRIRLYEADQQTRANAELTAFHETFPGHHIQIELANERCGMHPITRLPISTGFVEGWARYAETLAEEMRLYTSNAARLNRRFWPGHGILVDVGIHAQGWTRERAVEFIAATGRKTKAESEALVDRIVMWPGQLTSYDTGAIEILALRERARSALGTRFDIKAFHDAILENGAVTLPMLKETVDRWIAAHLAESRDHRPLSPQERRR